MARLAESPRPGLAELGMAILYRRPGLLSRLIRFSVRNCMFCSEGAQEARKKETKDECRYRKSI